LYSIGLYPSLLMSPRPSIGSPSGLTTLPRNSSPTGILADLPVLTTVLPSLRPASLSRRITPMSSLLMSSTIPLTPPSKITISP